MGKGNFNCQSISPVHESSPVQSPGFTITPWPIRVDPGVKVNRVIPPLGYSRVQSKTVVDEKMAATDWLYVTFVASFVSLGSFLCGYSIGSVKTLVTSIVVRSDCHADVTKLYCIQSLVYYTS